MKFLHLQSIYKDMLIKERIADTFNVMYNRHPFRCMLLAGNTQRTFFLCTVGENFFVIRLELTEEFEWFGRLDTELYLKLCKYLNLHYDPENPFKPSCFFAEIDTLAPGRCTENPPCYERASIINHSFTSENKPFFKGWIQWKKNHTSKENMYLTASLIGFQDAERCKRANISSAWSADPDDENLDALIQWASMIEKPRNVSG